MEYISIEEANKKICPLMSTPDGKVSCNAKDCMKWEPSPMPYHGADTTICNTPPTYSKTHGCCVG